MTSHAASTPDRIQFLYPVAFQLPTKLNDGSEVDAAVLEAIFILLSKQFSGGLTVIGACSGYWEGQQEPSVRIEVAVSIEYLHCVRALALQIGRALRQEAMYLIIGAPIVEIVRCSDVEMHDPEVIAISQMVRTSEAVLT